MVSWQKEGGYRRAQLTLHSHGVLGNADDGAAHMA